MRVVACMTSHNRRETTLAALAALREQVGVPTCDVILVDAGSLDGTAEAVEARYPEACVVRGGVDLYWSSGTRLAMGRAELGRDDALLLLNDDTLLQPHALEALCATYEEAVRKHPERRHVVVGTTCAPDFDAPTYGGLRAGPRWRPLRLTLVPPGPVPATCDTFNGNVVLIPSSVVADAGFVERRWVHGMGDIDYGFRLSRRGVALWVCPVVAGTCSRNDVRGTWQDASLSLSRRLRLVLGVKGLPPRQYAVLCRRWGGPLWPLLVVSPYVRLIVGAALRRRLSRMRVAPAVRAGRDRSRLR